MNSDPQASIVTSGAGWLAGVALNPTPNEVHFHVSQDSYVVFSKHSDDPGEDGATYRVVCETYRCEVKEVSITKRVLA